ncbi:MAG: hypothetical protein Q4F05_10005 [bacterium]|nr:hypothetical protein [bacterium]
MKRRYLVSAALAVISLVILLGIAFRSKGIDDFVDYMVIDKIVITNGANDEVITIKDEQSLAKVKEYMDNLKFRRKIGFSSGEYLYRMDLYYGMNIEIRFTFREDSVQIDNGSYTMSNLNDRSIEEFLDELKNK